MIFCKKQFEKNANRIAKMVLKGHLDVLDGTEVRPFDNGKYYIIDSYIADGKEYELYPIPEDWCK